MTPVPKLDIIPSITTLQAKLVGSEEEVLFEKTLRRGRIYYVCKVSKGSTFKEYTQGDMYPDDSVVYALACQTCMGNDKTRKSYEALMHLFDVDTKCHLKRVNCEAASLRHKWESIPGVKYPQLDTIESLTRNVTTEPPTDIYISVRELKAICGYTTTNLNEYATLFDPNYIEWYDKKSKHTVRYFRRDKLAPFIEHKLRNKPVTDYDKNEWVGLTEAMQLSNSGSRASLARFVNAKGIRTIRGKNDSNRIVTLYSKTDIVNVRNEK